MDIIVNDTNIFIDLFDCNLLNEFFRLPYAIHTVDFVISELTNETQLTAVNSYAQSGKLTVNSFNPKELEQIYDYSYAAEKNSNLSITDCSVLIYARNHKGAKLLTGDSKLRARALKESVDVCGILFVFDELVRLNIIDEERAAERLKHLVEKNLRLPVEATNDRIKKWSKEGGIMI